ncbi:hypothetical protein GALMADRAFT_220409 [Galerina marginata CBS 339.88]|uniref:Protein kinase domain-containing protein n=1 Tax=Galerina marginata (strain CBS 339.88) TaxID=685588 RepID=A0A067TGT0_GALM3|nr:hypothetical protein GALMADRAFT_220409 [Galerina marginata CBS 339.88]
MRDHQAYLRYLEAASAPGPLARTTSVHKVVRDESHRTRFLAVEGDDVVKKEEHSRSSTRKRHVLHLNDKERSLTNFRTTKEMLGAMLDAMVGHRYLHEDVGKLHGDISPGTIFMNEHGRGRLVDWEHSKYGEEMTRMIKRLQDSIAASRLGARDRLS